MRNNCFNNIILLISGPNFELLLEEYRRLLIIITNNLVYNILPIAVHSTIKKTAVIEGLSCRQISLSLSSDGLVYELDLKV